MDRLQAAIEKAREQRAEVLGQPLGQPLQQPTGLLEPGDPQPASGAVDANWSRLPPINENAPQLGNNRMIAVKGGSSALPYDMLRTRILQQARQNGWRRVGLVSPTAGCGKTTTAANLAFAFRRQRDVRSIILDLDLRRPCLNVVLGQDARGNIGDVIEGRKDFRDLALRLGDNVALGLNDSATETSSEILQSRQAQARLAEVEAQLDPDIVLCDLPPMMATDDNFGFLSNVDCVLLMVAAEETQTAQIEATLRHLGDLTTVMGIILSKCRHVAGAYGYDDQYHYA